jgi:hypothetical protein
MEHSVLPKGAIHQYGHRNGKALIQRFNDEVWGKGNLDVVYEVFAPDYVRHDLRPGNPLPGPEGQKNIAADFAPRFLIFRRRWI